MLEENIGWLIDVFRRLAPASWKAVCNALCTIVWEQGDHDLKGYDERKEPIICSTFLVPDCGKHAYMCESSIYSAGPKIYLKLHRCYEADELVLVIGQETYLLHVR